MEIKYKSIYTIFFLSFLLNSCNNLNLGKKLFLWGDNEKYYTITFCDEVNFLGEESRCAYIIPPYSYDENKFDYVEKYRKNKKWLLVRSNYTKYTKIDYNNKIQIDTTYQRYWAIDKSYNEKKVDANIIISSYLIGPLDSVAFYNFLHEKKLVSLWEK